MTWPPDRPERYGPPGADRGEPGGGARRDPRRGSAGDQWPAGQWQRRDPGARRARGPAAADAPRGRPTPYGPPADDRYAPPPDDRNGNDRNGDDRNGDGRHGDGGEAPADAAVLAAVVLILATTGWAVLRHYDGRVRHVPLTFSAGVDRPAKAGGGTQNILLVGSDSRAGTNGAFGAAEGQRSDTTILAHLDASGSTTLISFPRDLWVRIPAYTDSRGTQHAAQRSKLNAAYSYGGPSLLVSTIEGLTGIRVDHYVQIDFVGFQGMTDALGGVTVCIRELPPELRARGFDNLHDHFSGFSGQVGENRLNGAQALAFVRQRYGLPESDIDRIRRQQQFLGVVFRRISATDTLLNPAKLINVVDAATSALTLDDQTSLADLRLLAVRMQAIGSGGVTFATVPATGGTRAGQSVLVLDPAQLGAFLKPFGGRVSQTTGAAGALAAVPATPAGPGGTGGVGIPVAWTRPVAAPAATTAAPAPSTSGSCTY
ncbi:Cell envelope-related function transcriptional attenuator common domain [Frankia canadensis]|uniref:Cell envelope-related function transcriptional attenuator common domain n=1 Tax=Frankia canadensis TaxID=1836972 RepID=A0A2I2KTP4_9ACTN|nr:LCP family protein [Frankia canadensis]SNQ49032.1 Cell envelope-related function transcriptional attenuator common domain [Frankia canadensis]SOU56322.1 Cell envelope-related function transcriptional attenuator common domain [Frankia canadensis]